MVSRDAYTSKNIVKKDIRLGEIEAEPSEVLQRALAGKILSDVFFRKNDEEELENHSGRRTRLTFVGTQCLFYDFDDASCDIDEFVSRLRIKPTFGYTTLSDGKIENGRKLHKFRLGYILSDFVYGLDNRERLWKEIARENNIVPTFIKGKKVQGEQDKYDKGCTSVQWFFGTNDKARTVFFPENIYQVPTELVGLPLSYDEYLSYREESERITADRKRQIARNEHFWDNESNKYLYRETLKGSGWSEEDDTCGIRRYPYFDVTICGRMKSLKIAKTDEDGNILKKDNNIIYETRLKRDKRKKNNGGFDEDEYVEAYRYKYQVVPFRDGEHRRVKLYVAAQKMAENYNKLREKEPWHPELDDTILFYFLHSYAHTYFELEGKGNTITNDELADIAISVNDDYREGNDTSFFDRETRTKRRAEPMMSMRFSMLTQRQKSALITSQIKVEDVLNNFDWTLSPSDNLERLNGAEKGKMYGGRKMKDDKSLKTFFKKIRKAIECGIYTNKAGRVIYDFNNFNNISKEVIDSFITYFDFSFSSFFKVSGKKGSAGRRGDKRRIVMEALEGVERMSVRKTQAFLKERGIEVSVGYLTQISMGTFNEKCSLSISTSNNIKERTILSTGKKDSEQHVRIENAIIDSLTKGITIKDISISLGLTERTIRRHIKKAKEAGIIRNEGYGKYSHWIVVEDKSYADKYPKNNNNTTSTTYIADKTGIFGNGCTLKPEPDKTGILGNNVTIETSIKQPTKFVMREDFENCREISAWDTPAEEPKKKEKEETKNIETAISQEHCKRPETVIENDDDTCMGNEEIESMSAALKGLIDHDIYEQSRNVPEPPFNVEEMVEGLDDYFYYTGEGKDRYDDWFDYSKAI